MQNLIHHLEQKTGLQSQFISNILKLLEEGATIPFIARYRKELTGGADDTILRAFEDVYNSTKKLLERKEEIKRLITERATLTPQILKMIEEAQNMRALEDIYRPFKEKKSSRASVAIANGLEPLAAMLQAAKINEAEFEKVAQTFVQGSIYSVAEAIGGACDIVAERYADDAKAREAVRNIMTRQGILEIKKAKNFNAKGVFVNFVDKSEKVATIPSHRYLGLMRGVHEKELHVKISVDQERLEQNIKTYKIPRNASNLHVRLFEAYKDGLKRLLLPSIEREIHAQLKEKADLQAISTFGKNLSQLLMTPPVSKRVILGIDPAFVSGCKLAVVDENGNYLDHGVIYPTEPKKDYENSKRKILEFVKRYNIKAIAIGNGTASRETEEFFARLNGELDEKLSYTIVSEAGASVYSASKIASQEYPNLDVTIRGAISIAGRLSDPMATLVKIDPKSLGIGQYQHDVDQKLLEKKLYDVTVDLVNKVGVDINSASASLLAHVAGIGEKVAQNIITYREENGAFTTKSQLLHVKGLGHKAYEQAAGFIRIKDAKNPLENTGIHPESYGVAAKITPKDLENPDIAELVNRLHVGKETLKDILFELKKPGFDPRQELLPIAFRSGLTELSMLSEGSFVSGIVRNITDFGAFVDIGLKNDGLIHISQMSEKRVAHPLEVLHVGEYLPNIEVVAIDKERAKVSLSLKK